jgi:tripartite-type tricarboxylate transporter receptor subunit TctC
VPTTAEIGRPDLMTVLWAGLFAPAATPRDVVETLHKAVLRSLDAEMVKAAYAKQLIRPAPNASLDEAKAWLAAEGAKWRKITGDIKIDMTE